MQGFRTQGNKQGARSENLDSTQMEFIENKIVTAIRDVVPSVVKECIEQLNINDVKSTKDDAQKVTKLLSQTLHSNNDEFPENRQKYHQP